MGLAKKAVKVSAVIFVALALAFLAAFILTSGDYHLPTTAEEDPSVPRVTINGNVFHAEAFGDPDNPVVVVIHGGPGWDYRSLLPLKALSDEFYVVFYDQRSTGLSPRVAPEGLTLESTLSDLDSIAEHYAMGRKVRLVGHSWGAMLAAAYLGRHPEKVSSAVLAEPGFLTTELMKESKASFGPKLEAGFLYRAGRAWFESLHIEGDSDARLDYIIGQVAPYANPEFFCGGDVPEAAKLHWRPGSAAMQAIMRSAMDKDGVIQIDLTKGVERFTGPVLFLAGECNRLVGEAHQAKQAKFFKDVELLVIKGSGHLMFGEKPAETTEIVREHLRQ